ncbi:MULTISPECIES: hypothetical protein [Novosphingobium]|uniref:hypothetical protein n=1 Tax=Novosphingobium TaxID=165696 RepID=UPI00086C387A|nr:MULTISPECIES: hypothetical protein [Novosphingobium]ODU79725.1 MAG: hypothetical protein ABT10_19860 [Novosphingobium sp. SCN 63-17]
MSAELGRVIHFELQEGIAAAGLDFQIIAIVADPAPDPGIHRQGAPRGDLGRASAVIGFVEARGLDRLPEPPDGFARQRANTDNRRGLAGQRRWLGLGIEAIADLDQAAGLDLLAQRAPDTIIAAERVKIGPQEHVAPAPPDPLRNEVCN